MLKTNYGSDPTKYVSITAKDFDYCSISDIAQRIKLDEYLNKRWSKAAIYPKRRKV